MMRVLSPIYPPEITPVRDGWYLTRINGAFSWVMMYWNGENWRWSLAGKDRRGPDYEWCALAFDPAAAVLDGVYGVFVPGATTC